LRLVSVRYDRDKFVAIGIFALMPVARDDGARKVAPLIMWQVRQLPLRDRTRVFGPRRRADCALAGLEHASALHSSASIRTGLVEDLIVKGAFPSVFI